MRTSAAPSARHVAEHSLRIGWLCTSVCTAQIRRISLQTFWKASDRRALSWMTWRTASGGSRNSRYAAKTDARTKNCRGKKWQHDTAVFQEATSQSGLLAESRESQQRAGRVASSRTAVRRLCPSVNQVISTRCPTTYRFAICLPAHLLAAEPHDG